MTKRSYIAVVFVGLGLALMVLMLTASATTFAQDGGDSVEEAARRGSVFYAQYCGACHGPRGEAIGSGPGFASIRDYDPNFAEGRIVNGYDSNIDDDIAMIGYGEEAGGPLGEDQVSDLLAYMSTWNNVELITPPLPEPNLEPDTDEVVGPGDAEAGARIYATTCLGCHGRHAQGVGDLENFPAFEFDENTIRLVATGDGHGTVPPFAENNGGPLTEQDLDNLEAYLSTIEVDEEEEGPQGVNILVIVMGLGAVLAVGGAYLANRQSQS